MTRKTVAQEHAAWRRVNDLGLPPEARTEFEAWAVREGFRLDRIPTSGHYDYVATKFAWQGVQAAWARLHNST
jgi:hypothetical protein